MTSDDGGVALHVSGEIRPKLPTSSVFADLSEASSSLPVARLATQRRASQVATMAWSCLVRTGESKHLKLSGSNPAFLMTNIDSQMEPSVWTVPCYACVGFNTNGMDGQICAVPSRDTIKQNKHVGVSACTMRRPILRRIKWLMLVWPVLAALGSVAQAQPATKRDAPEQVDAESAKAGRTHIRPTSIGDLQNIGRLSNCSSESSIRQAINLINQTMSGVLPWRWIQRRCAIQFMLSLISWPVAAW